METLKSYTDIEQSKKLAEILSPESADMYYSCGAAVPDVMTSSKQDYKCYTACWSLAALMNLLGDNAGLAKEYGLWYCYDNRKSHCTKHYETQIDAVFEMVCWLKKESIGKSAKI